jgi:hypothetical protein
MSEKPRTVISGFRGGMCKIEPAADVAELKFVHTVRHLADLGIELLTDP